MFRFVVVYKLHEIFYCIKEMEFLNSVNKNKCLKIYDNFMGIAICIANTDENSKRLSGLSLTVSAS